MRKRLGWSTIPRCKFWNGSDNLLCGYHCTNKHFIFVFLGWGWQPFDEDTIARLNISILKVLESFRPGRLFLIVFVFALGLLPIWWGCYCVAKLIRLESFGMVPIRPFSSFCVYDVASILLIRTPLYGQKYSLRLR